MVEEKLKGDKLDKMFKSQERFQTIITNNFKGLDKMQYDKDMILGLFSEVNEVLGEIPWKPWKVKRQVREEDFKEEIIDCYIFLMNICINHNINSDDVYRAYKKKLIKNYKRHNEFKGDY